MKNTMADLLFKHGTNAVHFPVIFVQNAVVQTLFLGDFEASQWCV